MWGSESGVQGTKRRARKEDTKCSAICQLGPQKQDNQSGSAPNLALREQNSSLLSHSRLCGGESPQRGHRSAQQVFYSSSAECNR